MTTYSPQKHAQQLADWSELIKHVAREQAAMRGDITRLLAYYQTKASEPDIALDNLIKTAFAAMGGKTWVVADLLCRSLKKNDEAALALLDAMAATGKDTTKSLAKSLGRYLAAHVPGAAYLTPGGLELRRSGYCGTVLAWHIVEV